MGKVRIGAECCNNCRYWQCAERNIDGDYVKVYSDGNNCSLNNTYKEWRDCCPNFVYYIPIAHTFKPDPREMRTIGEVYLDAVMDDIRERRAARAAETTARHVCSRCGGTKRVTCSSCGGSGQKACSSCDGEGGFITRLEVREDYERFAKSKYWLPDADLDLSFYGIAGGTIDSFDDQRVICKKNVEVAFEDEPRQCTKDALQIDDSMFAFPESATENFKTEMLEKFEALCAEVDNEATKWDGCSWSPDFRIKEATVSVKQSPCIVRVTFKDALGFPYMALINLANNKVHLYDVDEEDAAEVMAELEAKANAGDVDLQNDIGQMYAHYPKFNHVVPEDREKAVSWFLKAARAGHADAMDNLGNCYTNGKGVAEDKELAVAWYQKAAKKGLAWGQFHFAKCLLNGTGIAEDDELALHWYLKAARQGLADAQNMVARCAEKGWGMKEDAEVAFFWMTRAAEGGHATAMNNLANFYEKGYGCESDSEKESEWRKKAEEHGYVRKASSGWQEW